MKKYLLTALAVVATQVGVQAAIINVTGANYVVTTVYQDRIAFGVDLVQNGPKETRTEIRINRKAHCYWVNPGQKDSELSVDQFYRRLHKGTRVMVNGARDWDGKVNASELWAQD
jgi:hypothetical protein